MGCRALLLKAGTPPLAHRATETRTTPNDKAREVICRVTLCKLWRVVRRRSMVDQANSIKAHLGEPSMEDLPILLPRPRYVYFRGSARIPIDTTSLAL